MTVREFQKCVEFNIRHNLKHAILGLGAPGVGKSQCVRQLGDKYGYKVIDLRLAQMSEVEIGGLIFPNEAKDRTIWLTPDILPDEKRDGEKTILLLDELTSCSRRVQVAAYQLILDRRIGQYTLPEGTFVIALGNREDDEGVYTQLGGPLADRFEIHFIEPDFREWLEDFALPNQIHPLVRDFLSFKPSALSTREPGEGELIFPTPRSWERVSDILKLEENVYDQTIRQKIIGNVGEAEGNQFIDFCMKNAKPVTAAEFLEKEATPPSDPDQISILVSSLLEFTRGIENIPKVSMLSGEKRDTLEKVIRALFRLPRAEYTVVGLKGLLDRNRPVVKTVFAELDDERISEFLKNNSYAFGTDAGSPGLIQGDIREKWLDSWDK